MRKLILLGILAALAVLGIPSLAAANQSTHYTGSDCTYAKSTANGGDQTTSQQVDGQPIYVYSGKGSTGNSGTTAAGVCAESAQGGGMAEVGTDAARGSYVVVDGHDGNSVGPSAGYMGISTYEDGTKASCPDGTPTGTGGSPGSTNSGGCLVLKAAPTVGVPIPVMCGFTTSPDWNNTPRDGCYIP